MPAGVNVMNASVDRGRAHVVPSAVNGSAVQLEESGTRKSISDARTTRILGVGQADAAWRVEDELPVGLEVPDEPAASRRRCASIHEMYGVFPKNVMSGEAASAFGPRPGCRR